MNNWLHPQNNSCYSDLGKYYAHDMNVNFVLHKQPKSGYFTLYTLPTEYYVSENIHNESKRFSV